MRVDDADIAILRAMHAIKRTQTLSTTDLAKKVFNGEIKNLRELRRKDCFVRIRLKKWLRAGVVGIEFECECKSCGALSASVSYKRGDACTKCGSSSIVSSSRFFVNRSKLKFGDMDVELKGKKKPSRFKLDNVMMISYDGAWKVFNA